MARKRNKDRPEEEFDFDSEPFGNDGEAEAEPTIQVEAPQSEPTPEVPEAKSIIAKDTVRVRLNRTGTIKTVGHRTAEKLISMRVATPVKE